MTSPKVYKDEKMVKLNMNIKELNKRNIFDA